MLLQSLDLQSETNADTTDVLASAFAIGDPVEVLGAARSRVQALTAADLQQLARRYLAPSARVLLIIGPHRKGDRGLGMRDPVFHTL